MMVRPKDDESCFSDTRHPLPLPATSRSRDGLSRMMLLEVECTSVVIVEGRCCGMPLPRPEMSRTSLPLSFSSRGPAPNRGEVTPYTSYPLFVKHITGALMFLA